MDLPIHIRLMARNNAWSNHRLFEACAALSQDEFVADRVSFFPSLRATLNHILAVDRYYIDALAGGGLGPSAFRDFQPFESVAPLRAAQGASDRRLIALSDRETAASLAGTVLTDRGEAGRVEEVRANLFSHLFMHQIHHRGQAHAMLAGTSARPPQLDEYLLVFDRAARQPDLAALDLEDPSEVR